LPIQIAGIGEALLDLYPDGRTVVGGAPLNFAVHADRLARRIGLRAAPISRIGEDEAGRKVLSHLESQGISIQYLQTDPEHPTGTVRVTLNAQGQPSYEITEGVAWDFLEPGVELDEFADSARAICFGTLAQRRDGAREVIEALLSRAHNAIRLFDVNLRQDYFDVSMLRRGCALATAVKINEEELDVVADMLQLRGNRHGDYIHALFDRFPIDQLLLTRGERGCILFTPNNRCEVKQVSYDPQPDADAVGAGDGAAAAFVVGMLAGLNEPKMVELANRVGAWVATHHGATPELPDEILALVNAA
jgi:fructokinase